MPPRKRLPAGSAFTPETVRSPSHHLESFLHYLEAECGMASNTVRAYGTDLRQFFEWYQLHGLRRIAEVDLKLLTGYLAHLRGRNLSATTVARHLVSIRMFFRYLVLEGILVENQADLLNSPKLWQHLPKVLSPTTVDQLLAAPGSSDRYPYRDRALLTLLYATGCRASEVTGLTLQDLHLEEAYCRCTGKGNKQRIIALNPVARLAVETYLSRERPMLAGMREVDALLLTRSGNPLSRITVWQLVKKYAARIGCSKEVSPHTLRHSFATHMLAGGADIRALQEMLGHASVATTQIYTHVEHSRLKAVHERCHPRG